MKLSAKDLIEKGYFPKELPPPFSSLDFSSKHKKIFPKNNSLKQFVGNQKFSECAFYSIPKAGFSRRILTIPNPLQYTALCEILEEKSLEISKHLKSKISCSLPKFDDSGQRAIVTEKEFSSFRRAGFLISQEAMYELKVDISRYYPTIYTHIIPWVIHGKTLAKSKPNDYTLLGNLLDVSIRNLQSKQTMGIPIGPDSSLVISEIIGCNLDRLLLKKFPKLKAVRYVDDYYFYVGSRAEAEKVLKFFQSTLSEYLLTSNEEKTTIKEFPFSTDPNWIVTLKSLEFTCFNDDSELEQESDIRHFFSMAFDLAEKNPKDEVMKYVAKIVQKQTISEKNWGYFQTWLMKMGIHDPYTLPEICSILFTNRHKISRQGLKLFIHELLERHTSKKHSFEVAWTLWLAKIFKIKIKNNIANKLFDSSDPIPTLIALDLVNLKLISKTIKRNHLKVDLVEDSLVDSRWLFSYESSVKNWLKPTPKNKKYLNDQIFFKKLATLDVSFYNEKALPSVIYYGGEY